MNFEVVYTPEQEAFREEVRTWIKANAEGVGGGPVDPKDIPAEQFRHTKKFKAALGKKGWFAPHLPKDIGGGGMSPEMALVLDEELSELTGWRMGPGYGPPDFQGQDMSMAAVGWLMRLGTEEQKQRWLQPILQGEWHGWELFTEPNSGSDLPSLQTTADRDGDEYVVNGTKIFVGGTGDPPDYLCTLAITDRDAPRHRNVSMLLIPADAEGISILNLNLLADNVKRMIHLDNVRVPMSNLVGQEGDGWSCFNGARFSAPPFPNVGSLADPYRPVERLIDYCKEAKPNGEALSAEPEVQQVLTKAYVDSKILSLLKLRNYWKSESAWMGTDKARMSYDGSQVSMYGKTIGPRIASAMLQSMGPAALMASAPEAPLDGAAEFYHRHSIVRLHPGGTVEIQRLRVFRGLVGSETRIGSA